MAVKVEMESSSKVDAFFKSRIANLNTGVCVRVCVCARACAGGDGVEEEEAPRKWCIASLNAPARTLFTWPEPRGPVPPWCEGWQV